MAGRTCSRTALSCVHDANLQSKASQQQRDNPTRHLWDSLVLAQCTGGQGRLRLEKRTLKPGIQMLSTILPKGPAMSSHLPLGKKNLTCSHVLRVGMEVFLNMASVS